MGSNTFVKQLENCRIWKSYGYASVELSFSNLKFKDETKCYEETHQELANALEEREKGAKKKLGFVCIGHNAGESVESLKNVLDAMPHVLKVYEKSTGIIYKNK